MAAVSAAVAAGFAAAADADEGEIDADSSACTRRLPIAIARFDGTQRVGYRTTKSSPHSATSVPTGGTRIHCRMRVGLRLLKMRARVAMVNGTFSIASPSERGTEIEIRIPLVEN